MVAKINAVHFEISERLSAFIHKKVDKLYRRFDFISEAEVTLKVVKPETSLNKEAQVKLHVPGSAELFASKTCDTFEEAVDLSLEALERQLEKIKEKK
ncbi:MAG: ribosome-associated translation inhibitor RaiA [Bacteroides sp.]|nr:ribosome-associated translation inhibitor RaiA [Bacteroides sp.]MDE6235693.1 ribosome-associated translation inhibitor RaiA [Muribaculaceae bacterium]